MPRCCVISTTSHGTARSAKRRRHIGDAKAFYGGPWLDGIVARYAMKPQIEFYEVFAVTDNARGRVEVFRETAPAE